MCSRLNVGKVARLILATGRCCADQQIVTSRHWFSAAWAHNRHQQQPNAPLQRPDTVQLGQHCLSDPYSWLSGYEESKGYLDEEKLHFSQAAKRLAPLQQQLLRDLRRDVKTHQADDPPEAVGPYLYRTHFTPQGTQTVLRSSSSSSDDGGQQEQVVVSDDVIQRDMADAQRLTGLQLTGSDLAAMKLSQDQQLLAYGVAAAAAEQQCCIVKDLRNGAVLPELVLPAVTSFEWSADGGCLYYTANDHTGRPSKVYRRSTTSQQDDALLFDESDARHFVTLTRTKDWRYVLINSTSKLSSEVHLLDADDPDATPVCVQRRQPGLEYFVEHQAGHLLLLTNHSRAAEQQRQQDTSAPQHQTTHQPQQQTARQQQQQEPVGVVPPDSSPAAVDYSLYALPVSSLGASSLQDWQLLLPEGHDCATTDLDVFSGCVVLHQLQHSVPQLLLLRLNHGPDGALTVTQQQQVVLPDWALWLRPGINSDYHGSTFRLYASSPTQPEVPLELDLNTAHITPHKHSLQPLPHNHHNHHHDHRRESLQNQQLPQEEPALHVSPQPVQFPAESLGFVSQRLWATAADGTAVPLTLLQQEGHQCDGSHPLLVEVYGAYGHILEAEFKPHRLPLLRRGWSIALAHVRGGGELGRRWHAAGRQLLKHHSVSDLLAVLQHLMDTGVTRAGLIAGHAASAGGLTLGAAINARPEWFAAAVLEAPYLDWVAGTGAVREDGQPLVGDHLLTEHEVDEWGDPWSDPSVAELVCRLCPYTNIQPGKQYPALMLTAGLQDGRVPWWMAVKYAAKLRSMQSSKAGSSRGGRGGGASQVLLQFDEEGSHFSMGLSGGDLQDAALQQAFLLSNTL